ncbi:MAG: FAD-binding oxidoreductase [Desulfurococcales archaeon]|nr:FAD-binding oxidoreductase [Desulfurococcales archaeon]
MEYDYIIVGAGIIGLTTAYHLLELDPGARIIVVDKAPGPASGDTSKSAAAFRVFFTNRVNFLLANHSVSVYRKIQESGYDLGMRFVGYLFMYDKEKWERIRMGLREADKRGLEYELYDAATISERLGVRVEVEGLEEAELMGAHNIEGGLLIPKAGIMMADRLASYYYEKLRQSENVSFAFNSKVTGFTITPREPLGIAGEPFPWQDKRVEGVVLEGGKEIKARKKVIVAAGAWTPFLLWPIGVDSFSRPKKRQIFVLKADTPERRRMLFAEGFNRYNVSPMLIFPNGAYMRPSPEESAFWAGYSDELGRPFKLEEDPVPEENFYIYGLHPMISLYAPAFEGARPTSSWAGHYDLSFDGMPVVYEAFESDLIVSAGTSGSGILKGDAIGLATAALAVGLEEVQLVDGETLKVGWLGLYERAHEKEHMII